VALALETFRNPPREYGILPFWFLNGELDPDEMRRQLRELRDKGMPGVILHGRYGLETPYLGATYLERIALAVEEADKLGLETWIYDEMNWPSGTADKRVLQERPDLAQRYVECMSFQVRGPWFTYLTGADSRYLDFERSRPVAAFAMNGDGTVIDLTPNLSFENVIPWEVPPGDWRLMYVVEKEADYYIDALNPEATAEFLRVGYEPYAQAVGDRMPRPLRGFYTDEPAMHYFVTAGNNAILPWTRDIFRRFHERNGYDLRPRLPDLFFDVKPDSARIRFDFFDSLSDFYSDAYYRQIHDWCRERSVVFTGHLLYEEWLRQMIRVEGNLFRHYRHFDIVGVDHLYPVIGTRESPDQHVAIKVASSAAHQLGSERLLCESFGGIFMDATMQRMKWIADWEYVLGVNLLNPHGFHYTLEGPRKRDWPPSQFYQYPWWRYYGHFSDYIARLSHLLSGGRHVAKLAVLWPINAMFATYTPQAPSEAASRMEGDFNALTDMLLRLHLDFDYLDEDALASARIADGALEVGDESYELLVLPPLTHVKLATVERLEAFVADGGRALAVGMLPAQAFDDAGLVEVGDRLRRVFEGAGCAFAEGLEDVEEAARGLVEPDVVISNPEIFYLHRVKDGNDVYFLVNPTFEQQRAEVTLSAEGSPVLWDPSTGAERRLSGSTFEVVLPPVGSVFVLTGVEGPAEAPAPKPVETITLDGEWEFEAADPNALVLGRWDAAPEGSDDWVEMVPGAWSYQLPEEPRDPYPIPVRYRATFEAEYAPDSAQLVVDGFAGSAWRLSVNGREVEASPERSPFDAQMRTVEIGGLLEEGTNVVMLTVTVAKPTDGLLDLLKIIGDFGVEGSLIVAPRRTVEPGPWTEQGYPFYSGLGTYRRGFELFDDTGRILLQPELADDVVEVVVNGKTAGVRLWPPYEVEITEHLQAGANVLELRVANTLVNLLEAVDRPSGLAGPPRIVRCR
jgi:alpha-L-rhamnosidase